MIKEFLTDCYLLAFHLCFALCRLFPLKKKIVFVTSFTENPYFVYQALKRETTDAALLFLCRAGSLDFFRRTGRPVYPIETINPLALLKSAYHLATARAIVVDNYYPFLSAAHFRKPVVCVQLWHAAGAYKTFGLRDHSIVYRSRRARRRFTTVYRHFDKIAVGSDRMERIFRESFGLSGSHFLHTGVPRTDAFFNKKEVQRVRRLCREQFNGKKMILYAPTFRDWQVSGFDWPFDPEKMEDRLGDRFVLLLKLHPLLRVCGKKYDRPPFIIDRSNQPINELLFAADILITDYSSIPFEFALLGRPMIFFPYDIADYRRKRGLAADYLQSLPGKLAMTTDELVASILQPGFQKEKVEKFSMDWNQYSNGHSSENIARYLKRLIN